MWLGRRDICDLCPQLSTGCMHLCPHQGPLIQDVPCLMPASPPLSLAQVVAPPTHPGAQVRHLRVVLTPSKRFTSYWIWSISPPTSCSKMSFLHCFPLLPLRSRFSPFNHSFNIYLSTNHLEVEGEKKKRKQGGDKEALGSFGERNDMIAMF